MRRLDGLAASPGKGSGRAWIIDKEGSPEVAPRDAVIVARVIHPYMAPMLAQCSGLVVEEGGLLQHAVILAREFGIPAVVGVRGAGGSLSPGEAVVVDGDRGVVEIEAQR